MATSNKIADAFDIFNRVRQQSTVLEEIWQQAYGQDYAIDAKPDAFYPLSVLDRIIAAAGPSDPEATSGCTRTLLDIGCGHGKTGLFLARRLNPTTLFGIDVSPASIALAQQNASTPERRQISSRFWVADATSTGLESGTCALVTCLDVLLYLPDKAAVFREIHRILESSGLFAFTTWEQKGFNERLGAQQVDDYRPLLAEAGFEVLSYDVVEGASEQQRRVFEGLVGREDALREELGEGPAGMFVGMARAGMEESAGRRYVFGLVQRREN